jgi:ABC-type transporter Mla MlaB component
MTAASQHELETEVRITPDGMAQVILRGRRNAQAVAGCWNDFQNLRLEAISKLHVVAAGLSFCDSAGLALLHYLNLRRMAPQSAVSVIGLEPDLDKLFRGFTPADYEVFHRSVRKSPQSLPEEVGNAVAEVTTDLREQAEFLGSVTGKMPPILLDRKRMRWSEVRRVFESAGANAVPIVSLASALVGLIIAFESAQPLAQFGAQIYVANMIGLVMVRELGPLLAAILLAGRSASAFAAELGTMKMNEELNALETFGLDPMRFLVLQRITAGILLTAESLLVTIREWLRGTATFAAVIEPGSSLKPNTLAEIEVTRLYGDFRYPHRPVAVLTMRFRFFEAPKALPGKVLLDREYAQSIPLKSATPAALMDGWNQALTQVFTRVISDFRYSESEEPR